MICYLLASFFPIEENATNSQFSRIKFHSKWLWSIFKSLQLLDDSTYEWTAILLLPIDPAHSLQSICLKVIPAQL